MFTWQPIIKWATQESYGNKNFQSTKKPPTKHLNTFYDSTENKFRFLHSFNRIINPHTLNVILIYVTNVWGNDIAGGFMWFHVYFFFDEHYSEKIRKKRNDDKKSFNFSKPSLKQHLLSPLVRARISQRMTRFVSIIEANSGNCLTMIGSLS